MNNITLKPLNSFAIDVQARRVIAVYTKAKLFKVWQQATKISMPTLVIGSGSNILFLENYTGTVLLNRIRGITINEDAGAWYLHVGAGEIWHNLVKMCLKQKIPGLENLALIPGYVGAAPIQNIGAYGVELKQFCKYVDILQLETGTQHRLNTTECQFGYRDSIFKHELREKHIITAVGLKLPKDWKPILSHNNLSHLNPKQTTPHQIYDIVCKIRRTKIPDPKIYGNAGSFFKNPTINIEEAKKILNRYPHAPNFSPSENKVKFAAGWLIEYCGLKGYRFGGAAVHQKQSLILINVDNATGKDIAALARYVRQQVADKFNIWLEPEVRFIDAFGEIDATGAIK